MPLNSNPVTSCSRTLLHRLNFQFGKKTVSARISNGAPYHWNINKGKFSDRSSMNVSRLQVKGNVCEWLMSLLQSSKKRRRHYTKLINKGLLSKNPGPDDYFYSIRDHDFSQSSRPDPDLRQDGHLHSTVNALRLFLSKLMFQETALDGASVRDTK